MKILPSFLLLFFFVLLSKSSHGQTDSLIFRNGNTMVGEIKSLQNGVVTIETPYSKADFTLKWAEIREIYSKTRFLITLKNGERLNGNVSTKRKDQVEIRDNETVLKTVSIDEIVFIKGLKSSFWSRAKANIDFGLNLTKANNLRQISLRSAIGYMADKWELAANYNAIYSFQDSVADTKRTDAAINYRYYLQHDWFLATSVNFLSNTEQALHLRTTGQVGGGKMLVHTNRSYFAVGAGISFNNESFTNETPSRNSWEAYVGTEVNLFDIGDLSLLSSLYVYPSLTESGRWRSDFKFDTKYDLPLDFYIKAGVTLNYDNRPAVTGNEMDYVVIFSFGWEL